MSVKKNCISLYLTDKFGRTSTKQNIIPACPNVRDLKMGAQIQFIKLRNFSMRLTAKNR